MRTYMSIESGNIHTLPNHDWIHPSMMQPLIGLHRRRGANGIAIYLRQCPRPPSFVIWREIPTRYGVHLIANRTPC